MAILSGAQPVGTMSGKDVLDRSIAYHDPEGRWHGGAVELEIVSSYSEDIAERLGYSASRIRLEIAAESGTFKYREEQAGDLIEIWTSKGGLEARLNGAKEIPQEEQERLRLAPDRRQFYRNYYEYLFGLPMKLDDGGTRIDTDVSEATFQQRTVLAVRVTYDPAVGRDVWYFYVDPGSYALVGCRFYHDESKNDGEYIVFGNEVEHNGLRLPKKRDWFTNDSDTYLGADEIMSLRVVTPTPERGPGPEE